MVTKIERATKVVVRPEMPPRKRDVRGTALRKHQKPLNGSVMI
jgi:hypothetical protein